MVSYNGPEQRKAWFTNKGQLAMTITLLAQLLVISFGAGRLVNAVSALEDQVQALTQRIARIENQFFRR